MSEQATGELLAEVPKNTREVIRLQRTEFNGVPLVDARVWTVPAVPGGDSKPTRKGLALRPETWAQLTAALRSALKGTEPGSLDGGGRACDGSDCETCRFGVDCAEEAREGKGAGRAALEGTEPEGLDANEDPFGGDV